MNSLASCVCFGYHKSLGPGGDCESCSSLQWKTRIHRRGAALLAGQAAPWGHGKVAQGRRSGGLSFQRGQESISEMLFSLQASILSFGESFAVASEKGRAGVLVCLCCRGYRALIFVPLA